MRTFSRLKSLADAINQELFAHLPKINYLWTQNYLNLMMMKKLFLLLSIILTAAMAMGQDLPYFAYNSFEGWIYNNPGLELNEQNISQARIRLYVDSQGLVVTLTSPEFSCASLDSIHAVVIWRSGNQSVALTMVLDDVDGTPLDSVSSLPSSASHDQTFSMTIPVPSRLTTARLRFVSWNATAATSGAVKRITLTGITGQPHEELLGDVDGNGIVNIGDVTSLISIVLSGRTDINQEACDIDKNGRITINDVTLLINLILRGGN